MICISNAKVRINDNISHLIRSDMETLIHQSNLGEENTRIAEMYLIDNRPHSDIAEELDLTRCSISYRYNKFIRPKLEETAKKIGIIA